MSSGKDWGGVFLVIAILMAIYGFIDSMWLNPEKYSSTSTYTEEEPEIYAP